MYYLGIWSRFHIEMHANEIHSIIHVHVPSFPLDVDLLPLCSLADFRTALLDVSALDTLLSGSVSTGNTFTHTHIEKTTLYIHST